MKIADVAKLSALDRFLYWMKERHQIYLRRKHGKQRPWTDDEVLQSYFFTNSYRETDKVTAWFREHVRDPLKDMGAVVFATIAFRWFNYIPTGALLQHYGLLTQGWDLARAVKCLTSAKEDGVQIFTGAFNISNSGSTKSKINRVCEDYIQPVWEDNVRLVGRLTIRTADEGKLTMQEVHGMLMQYPGLGGSGFMAAQVVADLRYTWVLRDAPDWWSWCSPGPGSRRGLNILLERPVESPIKAAEWNTEIAKLCAVVKARGTMPPMCAQDLQNCLCEFFKYERARQGGGSKRKYRGM